MNPKCTENVGLFDLDGSLADYDKAVLAGLSALKSPGEPEPEIVRSTEEHIKARVDLITRQPNWWLNLEPIPMGFQIVELAKEIGFQIHVLTQGPKYKPMAWKEKVEWCQKHLGNHVDIHITRNKGLVYGKFLYDDYPEYMKMWLKHRPRGLGIMPLTNENAGFKHPQVIHWDGTNLDEVAERLHEAYVRPAGKS